MADTSTPANQPPQSNGLIETVYSSDKQLNDLLSNVVAEVKSYADSLIEQIGRLTEIGQALSAERNLDKLLELIVDEACAFANADAGTVYIKEDDVLKIKIFQNKTLNLRSGGTSGDTSSLPAVELTESNVSGYVAIRDVCVNIPDVYHSDLFDFTGPIKSDKRLNYRTQSMLVVPMKNHEDEVIGVLQLINALDRKSGEVIPFSPDFESLVHSLASQAAVAITNVCLIHDMEELFNSFVQVMATAIDEKSPVTAGHIRKVAVLTMVMADIMNEQRDGPFREVSFNEEQLKELNLAAWMHDIGKVTTPVHIVEKGKKLEAIFDRIHLVKTRFHYIAKSIENDGLKTKIQLMERGASSTEISAVERDTTDRINEIVALEEFITSCNEPSEFMDDDKMERLQAIGEMTYQHNGTAEKILSDDELHHLSIRKGSITKDEQQIMRDHISITIKMLNQIPFTKKLKNVPQFAGAHHEHIDGTGYPNGLKGEELSLEGRLLAVTDIAEALTAADRPYKKAMPIERVHSILTSMAEDEHLDSDIVNLFINQNAYERYLDTLNSAKQQA